MKRLMLAAALAAGLSSSAAAVETWQGDLFITSATAKCVEKNWLVNDFLRAVFRPAGLEDNGTETHLALISGRAGQRYTVPGALAGNGSYTALGVFGSAAGGNWTGNFAAASVKPPVPTVDTKSVQVRLKISTFASTPGCTVTLEGTLGNRPNF